MHCAFSALMVIATWLAEPCLHVEKAELKGPALFELFLPHTAAVQHLMLTGGAAGVQIAIHCSTCLHVQCE